MKTYVFSCGPLDAYRWTVTFQWEPDEPVEIIGRAPDAASAIDAAQEVAQERTGNLIPPDRVELVLDPEVGKDGVNPRATRIVYDWHTICNNCGRESDLSKRHEKILGYGPDNGKPGCGIRYQYEYDAYGRHEGDLLRRLS